MYNQKMGSSTLHINLGSRCYDKAKKAEKEYEAKAYWMAVQFDDLTYSIYIGSLEELNGRNAIPLKECENGDIGVCLEKDKRHYFDFSFFTNK
jgi:hypothetical protein